MNPHEQNHHVARWHAAGLDPDLLSAAVAERWLAYVAPVPGWELAVLGRMRAWRYITEEVGVLVLVAMGVDE